MITLEGVTTKKHILMLSLDSIYTGIIPKSYHFKQTYKHLKKLTDTRYYL